MPKLCGYHQIADKYPSQSEKVKSLQRDVKNCENILKMQEEREKEMLQTFEENKNVAISRRKQLDALKKQMDNNPALHTLEYVEQKIESNMEKFKESVETLFKTELKCVN